MFIKKPKSFEESNIPPIMPKKLNQLKDADGSIIGVVVSEEVDIPDLGSIDPTDTFGFAKYINTLASVQEKQSSPIAPMDALAAADLANNIRENINTHKNG